MTSKKEPVKDGRRNNGRIPRKVAVEIPPFKLSDDLRFRTEAALRVNITSDNYAKAMALLEELGNYAKPLYANGSNMDRSDVALSDRLSEAVASYEIAQEKIQGRLKSLSQIADSLIQPLTEASNLDEQNRLDLGEVLIEVLKTTKTKLQQAVELLDQLIVRNN